MGRRSHPVRFALPALAAVRVSLGLAACTDPSGIPGPIVLPELVDFNGRYSVTHSFSVPGTALTAGCTGDADLSSNLGLAFGGTIDIDASGPCAEITNRVGQLLGSVRGEEIPVAPKPGFDTTVAEITGVQIGLTTIRVEVGAHPDVFVVHDLTVIRSSNPDL